MQDRLSKFGGQHRAPIGDSTSHHVSEYDFSVALANAGGQHAAAIGTSTKDKSDRERDQQALAEFNAALQDAVTATFGQAF